MFLLVESIRLKDGQFHNLGYHQARMVRSLKELFGYAGKLSLEAVLDGENIPQAGVYKCRICYEVHANRLVHAVEFLPYPYPRLRSLKVVTDDEIEYRHKFTNRNRFDFLWRQKGACDDVLIIRQGAVTDCSFANIAFRRGETWFTPADPLLHGTMRRKLLDHERVVEADIRVEDLGSFETWKPVNAMLGFDAPEIEVSDIVF